MRLYDPRLQQLACLPLDREPGAICLYVQTPHDAPYLGHIFTYALADCLIRCWEFAGYRIHYVHHVSRAGNTDLWERAASAHGRCAFNMPWTLPFIQIMQALNMRPPDDTCSYYFDDHGQYGARQSEAEKPTDSSYFRQQQKWVIYDCAQQVKTSENRVLVQKLLRIYSPNTIRFYLASQHYRRGWRVSKPLLQRASEQVKVLEAAVASRSGLGRHFDDTPYSDCIISAINEDLNTCGALSALLCLADEILAAAATGWRVEAAQARLSTLAAIFGLRLGLVAERRVVDGWLRFVLPRPSDNHTSL